MPKSSRIWQRRLSGWTRSTADQRWLFLEALVVIGAARLAIKLFTFQRLKRHLGTPLQDTETTPLDAATHTQLAAIGQAIRRAARIAPWHAMCYEQALTARWMLTRRRYRTVLYIGMRKGERVALEGHAWLRVGDYIVTGNTQLDTYTVVGTFVAG